MGAIREKVKRASLESSIRWVCSFGIRARHGALGVGRVRMLRAVEGERRPPSKMETVKC